MSDELRQGFAWLFAVLGVVFVLGSSTYASVVARDAAATAKATVTQLQREGTDRRDQSCKAFERSYRERVTGLETTYQYLIDLKPDERDTTLNRLLLRNIPEQEKQVAAEHPPVFCDEPGIGLPGTDPKVPKRPRAIDELLKQVAK